MTTPPLTDSEPSLAGANLLPAAPEGHEDGSAAWCSCPRDANGFGARQADRGFLAGVVVDLDSPFQGLGGLCIARGGAEDRELFQRGH